MSDRIDLRTEIDLRSQKISMKDLMQFIERKQALHPEREYWMDGDTFSIRSALRRMA